MNRQLIGLAAFYFSTFGALGALLPFLPLLFRERGLSESTVGALLIWLPAASLWSPPLWGVLCDRLQARASLMRFASLGSAVALGALWAADRPETMWLAIMAFGLFRGPLGSMADAETYAALGSNSHRYAQIRLWGSVGFMGVASGVAPWVPLEGILGIAAAGHVLAAGAAFALRDPRPEPAPALGKPAQPWAAIHSKDRGAKPRSIAARLGPLLLATTLYASATGVYDGYVGLRLRDLGFEAHFVGWAWGVAVGAEIALMTVAPRWIRRWDHSKALAVLAVVASFRWWLLASLEHPLAILASQLLHAFTFGLWFLLVVQRVQSQASEEERTTMQSWAASAMGGGLMLGVGLGGPVYDHAGGPAAFQAAALLALVAGVFYAGESRISAGSLRRPSPA